MIKEVSMYNSINCMCPNNNLEGTMLTRDQVEEISTRISNSASENVSKQLEKAISSITSSHEEKNVNDN